MGTDLAYVRRPSLISHIFPYTTETPAHDAAAETSAQKEAALSEDEIAWL